MDDHELDMEFSCLHPLRDKSHDKYYGIPTGGGADLYQTHFKPASVRKSRTAGP